MESGAVMVLAGIVWLVPCAWLAVRDVKRQRRRLPLPPAPSAVHALLGPCACDRCWEEPSAATPEQLT
jgi:hypothetical protein